MNNYADRLKCRRCGNSGGEERLQVRSNKRTIIDANATVQLSSSLKFVSKKEKELHNIKKRRREVKRRICENKRKR